jgi:hypothetical protein
MKVGDLVKLAWQEGEKIDCLGVLVRYETRSRERLGKLVHKEGWVVLWNFIHEGYQIELFQEESKLEVI